MQIYLIMLATQVTMGVKLLRFTNQHNINGKRYMYNNIITKWI
jgi:hypothetical protein